MPNFSNVDSINSYYKSLQEPINANMRQAENDYNANLERLRQTKEGQDAQAYRALQRQLKTVPEEMSAAGGQGGMVDSGIAFIKNRYLQGRNDRDTQLAADNAALGRDYQNTLEGYRGQLAQYEQQAAADRAELEYQQALAAARASSGGGGGGGRRYYSRGSGNGSGGTGIEDPLTSLGPGISAPNSTQGQSYLAAHNAAGTLRKANTRPMADAGTLTKNIAPARTATTRTTSNLANLDRYNQQ